MYGLVADCRTVTDQPLRRFLKLDDVAEMLATSPAQVYALVRRGELRAIKLGGRGQWRCSVDDVEAFVERLYSETQAWIEAHPFTEAASASDDDASSSDGGQA